MPWPDVPDLYEWTKSNISIYGCLATSRFLG